MSFFPQSTFKTMFSNDENSGQNTRPKIPKIDIDLDPFRVLSSLFSPKSNSTIKSCCENCSAKFGLMKSKKICQSCKFEFCVNCFKLETDLGNSRSTICLKCRVFSKRPLKREDLIKLRVKDLKWFLRSHRISSSLCKEKSDLVDLIMQHFGLRNSNQPNQPGPSRRSFDDFNTPNRNNENANNQEVKNNQNDNHSNESTESEWEFLNEGLSSINNSNQNSGNNSQQHSNGTSHQNSNHNSNYNSNNQTPYVCTPTNDVTSNNQNLEFVNLNVNNEIQTESNSNEINFTILDDNVSSNLNNDSNLLTDDDRTEVADFNRRFEENESRNTSSTSRLLDDSKNLGGSTDSLLIFKNFNIEDVKSEEEIKSLSVRQLKLVLTRNYVNYKGCCEKEELQEKAIRLWNQIRQDNDLIDDTKDEDLCKICMEKVINCVLLECGHLVTCLDCGKRLNECPVCRQFVVRALRIFKS